MLSIRVDDREMRKAFKQLRERQIPYAIAGALNDIAEHARQDIVANMQQVFDRPTKFTLNTFYTQKASPKRLTATVGIRDFARNRGRNAKNEAFRTRAGTFIRWSVRCSR